MTDEAREELLAECKRLGVHAVNYGVVHAWKPEEVEPIDCLKILECRIVSCHFKDKEKMGDSKVVRAGEGVVNAKACLEELKRQGFDGHISIEHENEWMDNVPSVRHNIDFIKANPK